MSSPLESAHSYMPPPSPSPFNREARRMAAAPPMFDLRRQPIPPPAPLGLPDPISRDPPFSREEAMAHRARSRSPMSTSSRSDDEEASHVSNHYAGDPWSDQDIPPSPNAMAGFASNLAAKVGSMVSSSAASQQPRSPGGHSFASSFHPSDAEIISEAEREREHSRREAERILTMEAEERRKLEEKVLAMLLPPPPETPQPSRNGKGADTSPKPSLDSSTSRDSQSWWSIAKQKLTPGKDKNEGPLTPAQQVVREAKSREKAEVEAAKEREKEFDRQHKNAWPASPKAKLTDPTYIALQSPVTPPRPIPQRQQSSPSPSPRPIYQNTSPLAPQRSTQRSPQPSPQQQQVMQTPPQVPNSIKTTTLNLSPSPGRVQAPGSRSNSGDAMPLYAQYNSNTGNLDIAATLLTVATRFEKLEKWAVNHVRALEDRMKDVERYLVDREGREDDVKNEVASIRTSLRQVEEDISDLKFAAPPVSVIAIPEPEPKPKLEHILPVLEPILEPKQEQEHPEREQVYLAPEPSFSPMPGTPASIISSLSTSISADYHSATGSPLPSAPAAPSPPSINRQVISVKEEAKAEIRSASPTPSIGSTTTGPTGTVKSINFRSRLPYPSGDYYDLAMSASQSQPPATAAPPKEQSLPLPAVFALPRSVSPLTLSPSDTDEPTPARSTSPAELRAPSGSQQYRARSKTPSPTPRKRYTVALSGRSDEPGSSAGSVDPRSDSELERPRRVHTALITSSPVLISQSTSSQSLVTSSSMSSVRSNTSTAITSTDNSPSLERETTIGRTPITLSRLSLSPPPSQRPSPVITTAPFGQSSTSTSPASGRNPRVRAQSSYTAPDTLPSLNAFVDAQSASPSNGRRRAQTIRDGDVFGSLSSASILSTSSAGTTRTFVDPLLIRKKEREKERQQSQNVVDGLKSPVGRKLPVGQLVAFFDGEVR